MFDPIIRVIALFTLIITLITAGASNVVAQDDPNEVIEDETKTAYACIAYQIPLEEEDAEPYGIIEEGEYEWVQNADCIQQPQSERPMPQKPIRTKQTAKSRPFWLPEGDYEVRASYKGKGCHVGLSQINLYTIDDDYPIEEFERGTDYAYEIEEGLYYTKGNYASGKCTFTLHIQPFEY